MELGYPVGVRFHPLDHELVGYYLHKRAVMGDQFRPNVVSDCPDFYGENEPWVIWDMYGGGSGGGGGESNKVEALYFFTHRKKLSPTAKRFDRKVGSGTWSGESSKEVYNTTTPTPHGKSVVIGISRHFRYEGGCDSHHNGAWLMQEYQMSDNDITVLCTLRKNPRKLPPPPPTATDTANVIKKRKRIGYGNGNGNGDSGDQVHQPKKPKAARKLKKRETNCDQVQAGSSGLVDQDHQQQPSIVKETNNYEVQNQDQFQDDQDYYPEPYPDLLDFDEPHYSLDELVAAPTPHLLSSSLESNAFQCQKDQSSYGDGDNFNLVSNDQSYDSNNFGLVSEDQLYDCNNFSLVSNEFQGLLYDGNNFELEESLWEIDENLILAA